MVEGTYFTNGWFWRAAFVEMIMTSVFVSLFIQIWKRNGAKHFLVNAVIVGLAYYVTSYMALGISGGCLNPMIGLAQGPFAIAYSGILSNDDYSMINKYEFSPYIQNGYLVYVFAPFLGGIIAGIWQFIIMPIM